MLVWKLAEQRKAESCVAGMASRLRHHILPSLGEDTSLAEVTESDRRRFRAYLGALVEEGELTGQTCNRILTALRQLYKYAELRYGLSLPAMPKGFPESGAHAPDAWVLLDPEAIVELLGHLPPQVRPLFSYVANTGLRIGTALSTQASWIDWELVGNERVPKVMNSQRRVPGCDPPPARRRNADPRGQGPGWSCKHHYDSALRSHHERGASLCNEEGPGAGSPRPRPGPSKAPS